MVDHILRSTVANAGAAETVVFEETLGSPALGNMDGFTVVNRFLVGSLDAASGDELRFSFIFDTLDAGCEVEAWFGLSATPGISVDIDFTGSQAQVTFASGNIIGDGSTFTYVSDWITIPAAFDNTDEYLLAIQFDGNTATLPYLNMTGVVASHYQLSLCAAATDKPAGSGDLEGPHIVHKIEVR